MFAGHIGAAMAIGRIERRVNLAAFVFAGFLLDVILWLLVLVGWESVVIPASFATTHQPEFDFPYSHGLLASTAWSALAGAVTYVCVPHLQRARCRAAVLVAAAVFSHWILDALVHAPELPLAGAASARIGLGWWGNMPVALALEGVIVLAGLYLFVPGAGLSRFKAIGLSGASLLVLVLTVLGMTVSPPPPSAAAMATSSLSMILLVCALVAWLGRRAADGDAA